MVRDRPYTYVVSSYNLIAVNGLCVEGKESDPVFHLQKIRWFGK